MEGPDASFPHRNASRLDRRPPGCGFDAVPSAMVEALKIPSDDRVLRIIGHEPADFPAPPGHGERFTIIEITMFAGQSFDAKPPFFAAIVRNLENLGCRRTT